MGRTVCRSISPMQRIFSGPSWPSERPVPEAADSYAPVRDVSEVMHDPHMHERGMLEWIEHDEIGRIVVPTSPLRFHGADKVATTPSPKLGQHNAEVYGS